MEIKEKIVAYEMYCKTCKYKILEEYKDPCNDCLNNPINTYSKKPVNYDADEKLVKAEEELLAAEESEAEEE